jgi:hypothetical protein
MPGPAMTKTKSPDGVLTIQVTPEAAPFPMKIGIVLGLCAAFFGYVLGNGTWAVVLFMLACVGGGRLYRSSQLNRYRANVSLKISKSGLELNGKHFPSDDIHRVTIKNHLLPQLEQEVTRELVVASETGFQSGKQVGEIARQDAAKTCYRVEFEAMGKPHILGGGLTEPEAFALATEVRRGLAV